MQKTKLKILMIGNEMNIPLYMSYRLLNEGYEVRQIFSPSIRNGKVIKTDQPENEFPELSSGHPDWLQREEPIDKMLNIPFEKWEKIASMRGIWRLYWVVRYLMRYVKFRHFQQKVKKLADHFEPDLIITRGHEVCYAYQLERPLLMTGFGSDIYETPLTDSGLFNVFYSAWRRRILRKHVDTLMTAANYIYYQALNYKIRKVVRFYAPPSPQITSAELTDIPADLLKIIDEYDCIYFCPMRFNANGNTSAYKGNEFFLEAFERFIQSTSKKVLCVLLESGYTSDKGQKLLIKYSIQNDVYFLKGDDQAGGRINRMQLWAIMKHPKVVVFDRFRYPRHANFGGIAREAMAAGSILVCGTEIEADSFQSYHPANCPAISVRDADELVGAMEFVASLSDAEFKELRAKTKTWQEMSSKNLWRMFYGEVEALLKSND